LESAGTDTLRVRGASLVAKGEKISDGSGPDQVPDVARRWSRRVPKALGWVLTPIYLGVFGVSIVVGSIVLAALRIVSKRAYAAAGVRGDRMDTNSPPPIAASMPAISDD
jgi:hypothetical protein